MANRPPCPPSLTRVELPEPSYRADFELLDRYLKFSSELLRLSLGGIAVIGFMLGTLGDTDGIFRDALAKPDVKLALGITLCCLGTSAGAALAHQYLAPDGMHHHLRAIRLYTAKHSGGADRDEAKRDRRFRWSGAMLKISSSLLFLGALALGAAILLLLRA